MVFGGGIQFGGLASGLDTGAIIESLLGVARVPINQLEASKAVEKEKLDLMGDLEKLVNTLRDKAKDLSTLGGFLQYKVTPNIEGVASLSVGADAVTGSHTLAVNSLATADRYAFAGVADAAVELGAGTVDFTYNGQSYSAEVFGGASSLNDVAAAINAEAGESVTASVVNAGTTSSPSYQLVVTGHDTGTDFAIGALGVTGSLATNLVAPAAMEDFHITTATNAEIVLDGLTIQRSDNNFDDVLTGVELSALSADPSLTMTFTVDADTDAVKAQLNSFIGAYNAVIDFINTQNEYDEDDGAGSELFGDPAMRSIRSTIQSALFNVDIGTVQSDTQGYSTLSLVGIEIDTKGRLSLNASKVDEKMAQNLELFADLFVDTDGFDNGDATENTAAFYVDTTADSGLFSTLFRAIDQAVKDVLVEGDPDNADDNILVKGLFGRRKETFNSNIDRMTDQIEALELRLESYEATLIAQYTALEEVISGLNAQGSSLAALNLGN